MTGDPLAEEPFCNYEPLSFPYQEEIGRYLQPAAHPVHA
jgi:hypothetical protein